MNKNNILYVPHGGGPMPLLGHQGHLEMISFLQGVHSSITTPTAIIVISAHWEEHVVSITSHKKPALIYDYSGFPQETYEVTYPAPGHPDLAKEIYDIFQSNGIESNLDNERGFDHGMFVPLKLMYPNANIPCIQISLVRGLDPETHLNIGKALSQLKDNNLLVVGSGMSFHNLRNFASANLNEDNVSFETWLNQTCTDPDFSESERNQRLIDWANAPSARKCHPREEHLIPLHICYGMAQIKGKLIFDGEIMGKKTSAYLW